MYKIYTGDTKAQKEHKQQKIIIKNMGIILSPTENLISFVSYALFVLLYQLLLYQLNEILNHDKAPL